MGIAEYKSKALFKGWGHEILILLKGHLTKTKNPPPSIVCKAEQCYMVWTILEAGNFFVRLKSFENFLKRCPYFIGIGCWGRSHDIGICNDIPTPYS